MSVAVNVLEVLRADRGENYADYQERQAAIAAVAELIEKSEAALHYMRLHKYADQAWADDLAEALARVKGGAE